MLHQSTFFPFSLGDRLQRRGETRPSAPEYAIPLTQDQQIEKNVQAYNTASGPGDPERVKASPKNRPNGLNLFGIL